MISNHPFSLIIIIYMKLESNEIFQSGGSEWNRTTDTGIFSPLLYRLSYRAKKMAVSTGIEPAIFCVTGRRGNHCTTRPYFGCGKRIWTSDLRVMSPTSYRAAPSRDIYKFKWRRKRDSNPCAACTTSRFSRPVPSTRLGYSSRLVPKVGLEPTRGLNLAGF